ALYPMLLAFAKDQKTDVPSQVLGEWSRSPVLAAAQDEINLLIDEGQRLQKFRKLQFDETISLYKRARQIHTDVRGRLKAATPAEKRDPAFRENLKLQYDQAKNLKLQYSAFKKAVDLFRAGQGRLEAAMPTRRQFLLEQIERDLASRNV